MTCLCSPLGTSSLGCQLTVPSPQSERCSVPTGVVSVRSIGEPTGSLTPLQKLLPVLWWSVRPGWAPGLLLKNWYATNVRSLVRPHMLPTITKWPQQTQMDASAHAPSGIPLAADCTADCVLAVAWRRREQHCRALHLVRAVAPQSRRILVDGSHQCKNGQRGTQRGRRLPAQQPGPGQQQRRRGYALFAILAQHTRAQLPYLLQPHDWLPYVRESLLGRSDQFLRIRCRAADGHTAVVDL